MAFDSNSGQFKNPLQAVHFIYYALLAGQLLFAGVAVFLLQSGQVTSGPVPMFIFIIPAVLVGGIGGAYFFNERFRQAAGQQDGIDAKMAHYRTRVILRSALIEGPNLLAIIAAIVTGQYNFLLIFLLGIAVFYYFKPKSDELDDYQLTPEERQQLSL